MQVINNAMKKLVIFVILSGWGMALHAQSGNFPSWINNRPITDATCSYYYRVTQGEGVDYDKAYAKAFARAILESSWKLGIEVKTSDDLQTIENGVSDNINVVSSKMTLPLNKVCEYVENSITKRGVRIYILWQVAKYGNRAPNFDEFTKCE